MSHIFPSGIDGDKNSAKKESEYWNYADQVTRKMTPNEDCCSVSAGNCLLTCLPYQLITESLLQQTGDQFQPVTLCCIQPGVYFHPHRTHCYLFITLNYITQTAWGPDSSNARWKVAAFYSLLLATLSNQHTVWGKSIPQLA